MLPPLSLLFLFTIYASGSTPHVSTHKLSNVLAAQSTSLIEKVDVSHKTKKLKSNSSFLTNKTGRPQPKFLKVGKHYQKTNLEPIPDAKADKPQMSFIKANKPQMMPGNKADKPQMMPDDKADKPQMSFIKANKPQMMPGNKADKPQMSFIKANKPQMMPNDKADKPQMMPDDKADKPQMSFIKANKPQMMPGNKADKPQMSFIKANKPQMMPNDKADKPQMMPGNKADKPQMSFIKANKPQMMPNDKADKPQMMPDDKADKPQMSFIKANKPQMMPNDKADKPQMMPDDKADKPQMSFIKANKPQMIPNDKADKPQMIPDDKADKPQMSFIKANKPQMIPGNKADKPQMGFINANKPQMMPNDKADKPQMIPDDKADKPQMSFLKADKPQMIPDDKADKPQMGFLKADKPQMIPDDKADKPNENVFLEVEETDNVEDESFFDFNPEDIAWTPEHILLGTYIDQLDRANMRAASLLESGYAKRDEYTRSVLSQKKLGIFRNLHTKPYCVILTSTIFTFFIMRWLNPYTIFKYNRKIKNNLGSCLLVPGYDDNDESEAKTVWNNDELLEKYSQSLWVKGADGQKRCKEFIKSPPGDAFDASSTWIFINIMFALFTMFRLLVNVNFKKLTPWEIYELLGLFFFNSSAFTKVIAQTQPILYNCVLYGLPSGAPEDKWTREKRQQDRDKHKKEKANMSEEDKKKEADKPRAQVLSQPPPEDGEEINELDLEPYDRQNYCEKRHGERDGPDDERLIACCWNVPKQKQGEEKFIYAMFAIPLSTEKMLDYDETFTTTISTIVSILTLVIFIIMCIPYAITHVIPMVVIYGWMTLLMIIAIAFLTYLVVTLPQLKRAVDVPVMKEDPKTGEKTHELVDADPVEQEDGTKAVPQERKQEKQEDGTMVDMKDAEGKFIMVNKKKHKIRVDYRDRACRYPWISCKAIPKEEKTEEEKAEEEKAEKDKAEEESGDKDKAKKTDGEEDADTTEEEKKRKEAELDAHMEKLMSGAGGGGCKNFLRGMVPNTRRDVKFTWKKLSMKWIDFRKIIVYFIFIYLYNFLFNWAILLYMGHGYRQAILIDFFSPSRKLSLYLKHVLNSIHTLVEFVNMLF